MRRITPFTVLLTALILIAPAAIAAPGLNLDNLDPKTVSKVAHKEILKVLSSNTATSAPLVVIADKNVPAKYVAATKTNLTKAYKFFEADFSPDKVSALLWLNKDKDSISWGQKQFNLLTTNWDERKNFPLANGGSKQCQEAFPIYGLRAPGGKYDYSYVECAGETSPDKYFKSIHEYTHLYQAQNHLMNNAPVWVVEGMADFYGQHLGLWTSNDKALVMHRKMLARQGRVPSIKSLSKAQFVTLMKKFESPEYDQSAYYFGSLATEALVAVFGEFKVNEFVKSFSALPENYSGKPVISPLFYESFETSFGVAPTAFYEKLYPYVTAMSKVYQ